MEKTTLGYIGAFVSGALFSFAITYLVVGKSMETKYAKLAQEEIDSVKERFTVPKKEVAKDPIKEFIKTNSSNGVPEDILKNAKNKPSISTYAKNIRQYTNYSNVEYEKDNKPEDNDVCFVISPDEFGEDEDYDQQELTFYADGILADEDDTILNADEVIGPNSLSHIGDYEDDAVHVKNTDRKVYYEVLVDNRSYKDATGKDPHQSKDEED